jgi:hypothetical protein
MSTGIHACMYINLTHIKRMYWTLRTTEIAHHFQPLAQKLMQTPHSNYTHPQPPTQCEMDELLWQTHTSALVPSLLLLNCNTCTEF